MNASGLHLRASTELAKLSYKFPDESIRLWKRGHIESERDPLDCRDPLQIALLVAERGHRLELLVEGTQPDEAFEAVVAFFQSGCGEGVAPALDDQTPELKTEAAKVGSPSAERVPKADDASHQIESSTEKSPE